MFASTEEARVQAFKDRVAVVTGAASGIGLALAERFATEGMKIVMADIEAAALVSAETTVRRQASAVLAVKVDVARPEDVERLVRETYATFGAAHVLCNNAGGAVIGAARSSRNRPAELSEEGKAGPMAQAFGQALSDRLAGGYSPSEVAEQVIAGIRADRFYIVPAQPEVKIGIGIRAQDLLELRNPTLRLV